MLSSLVVFLAISKIIWIIFNGASSLSNHFSGMLFCPSELGFQKVYDWMVISLVIAFEALIAYFFLISKPNVALNCEIPKELQNMSTQWCKEVIIIIIINFFWKDAVDHLKLDMLPLIPTKIINSERTWTFKNNLFAWFLILGNNVTRMKKKKWSNRWQCRKLCIKHMNF